MNPRSRRSSAGAILVALALAAFASAPATLADRRPDGRTWVATWSASPQAAAVPIRIEGQTLRQIVHTSLGGERVRVRLSNSYGTSPVKIGSAHVAVSAGGSSIVPGTDRVLTFGGSPAIAIPAGAVALSDAVALDVPALGDLAVSLYFPDLIGNPAQDVTADQIVQGHRQIIARARAMGLRVYGGTLFPVEGYPFPGFWTAAMEDKRQAVNRWIRTADAYDAVIDFDRVLRDPANPARLMPAYDSGDHVHPNDAGYRAMAESIDLSLFRNDDED